MAKWKLPPYDDPSNMEQYVLDKIPVAYNIGHLVAAEGDTVSPDGGYLIAMNKWAIDRFADVGPLLPQNFQLVDISGEKMQLLYDMPLPLGEPHYAVAIEAGLLKPGIRYKVGTNTRVSRLAKPRPKTMVTAMEMKKASVNSGIMPNMVVSAASMTGRILLTPESMTAS